MARRIVLVVVAAVWLFIAGSAPPAVACTGCLEPMGDVVGRADRVLIGTFLSVSETGGDRFSVERVLKGSAPAVVSFPAGSARDFAVGSRWILVLYPGHELDTVNAFEVEPDGTVVPPGPFDTPTTLAGFIAWFATPATDSADPPATQSISALGLAVVFVAALLVPTRPKRSMSRPLGR
jgi:hypothetical protein